MSSCASGAMSNSPFRSSRCSGQQSVDISDDFVDTVQKINSGSMTPITPYELYLKLIYEYLQEDINLQDNIEIFLPEGFMALQYQQQAVQQAMKKLNEHNGVFLADVVGSGKTFIAAQCCQQIKGRILVDLPTGAERVTGRKACMISGCRRESNSLGKLEKGHPSCSVSTGSTMWLLMKPTAFATKGLVPMPICSTSAAAKRSFW